MEVRAQPMCHTATLFSMINGAAAALANRGAATCEVGQAWHCFAAYRQALTPLLLPESLFPPASPHRLHLYLGLADVRPEGEAPHPHGGHLLYQSGHCRATEVDFLAVVGTLPTNLYVDASILEMKDLCGPLRCGTSVLSRIRGLCYPVSWTA